MCQKMPSKSAKSRNYSLSRQNSVKIYTDFTRAREKFTPTLLARWYVFPSLCMSNNNKCFSSMSNVEKFKTLVCPTNSSDSKLVSRYLQTHFDARNKIYVGGE